MSEAQGADPALEHPTRRRPSFGDQVRAAPLTFGLIAFTSSIFLLQLIAAQLYGFDLLLALGAKDHRAIQQGQLWRYLTPMLLHVDPMHLLVNMYSLYVIGPPLERPYGAPRFALVYLLSGLGGVVASLALSTQPSAGASGAIFGLLGGLAAFLYMHRDLTGPAGRGQLRHIALVAVVNLAIGLSPGIDNWGHAGGLLTGLGLGLLVGPLFRPALGEEVMPVISDVRPLSRVWARALLAAAVIVALAWVAADSPLRG